MPTDAVPEEANASPGDRGIYPTQRFERSFD